MIEAEVQANFYEVLHVDRDASPSVIRESYRRLMQHAGNHPDLGGDTRTAALINKAYAVLSDPAQRRDYDLRLEILNRVTTGIAVEPKRRPLGPGSECLFCEHPHDYVSDDTHGIGCDKCGSPLQAVGSLRLDTNDKRAVERLDKRVDLTFFTHWRQARGFVENDKKAIRELAELYDPEVPVHENPAYVERTKEVLASHEDAMRGSSTIFGSRNERGWMPPSLDDVATAEAESATGG